MRKHPDPWGVALVSDSVQQQAQLVYCDSKGDGAIALACAKNFKAQGVQGYLAPWIGKSEWTVQRPLLPAWRPEPATSGPTRTNGGLRGPAPYGNRWLALHHVI